MAAHASDSPGGFQPGASTSWPRVLLIQVAGMVASFPVGKVPPVLPQLQVELSLSLFMAGWVISSLNILAVLSAGAAGAVADWWGHRRLLIFGLVCQVAGSLAGSMADGSSLLLTSRVAEGLGYICVAVAAPVLIMRITHPRDLRMAMGVWGTFMPAGAAFMMVLSPWLQQAAGWRGLWQINSGLALAFIFVFAACTKDLSKTGSGSKLDLHKLARDMREVAASGQPLLFALNFCCFAMMFLAMMGFLPMLLVEGDQVSAVQAGWMTALVLLMNVVGNLCAGFFLQRGVERHWLLTSGFICIGLCSLGIYDSSLSLAGRYTLCLLFAMIGGMIPATNFDGATATAPKPALTASSHGLLMQGAQVGQLAGPPALAAWVSGFGGWESAPWFLGAFSILGLLTSWGIWRSGRRGKTVLQS